MNDTVEQEGLHGELMGIHVSAPPQWTVPDRFMMDNGHDCPITDVWSLFLCSCLLIIVRNKGIPTVIVQIPINLTKCSVFTLHACTDRVTKSTCQKINILYTMKHIINEASLGIMNC